MNDGEFLHWFNASLSELNAEMMTSNPEEHHANIYVIGLPRSGTTLLTQVLFNALDIACTNNFVSKYWEAPLVGFKLADLILGDHKTNVFSSVYGKNKDPYSPHEFSYFWHRLLNMTDEALEKMDYEALSANVNWSDVRQTILNINLITGKPVVYKPLELIANCLTDFQQSLPKSLFVYIERDPQEVALSLAKGRLDYYQDIHTWFSSLPPLHEELLSAPYEEQIAEQVVQLRDMYDGQLATVKPENVLRIHYDDLCANPQHLVEEVAHKVSTLSGNTTAILRPVTKPFKKSIPQLQDAEIANNIKTALAKRL